MENQLDIHNVAQAEQLLRQWAEAYHNGTPMVSDAEYDTVWRRHLEARRWRPNAPCWGDTILDKVGAAPSPKSGFDKLPHSSKMYSLANVFEQDDHTCPDLLKWVLGVKAVDPEALVVIEPKIDGLSIALRYVDGLLQHAILRGDGVEGDDVVNNIARGKVVPLLLGRFLQAAMAPGSCAVRGRTCEIRGEVYMSDSAFAAINARLVAEGQEPFANPRNAASGIIRRHTGPIEGLSFLAHGAAGGFGGAYYLANRSLVKEAGIAAPKNVLLRLNDKNEDEMREWLDIPRLQALLTGNGFPTDGLVFKVNEHSVRDKMGFTAKDPRWAVALKFIQPAVVTRATSIVIQVGRSGVLTPVTNLEPVLVDGSTVSRATLHNEEYVRRLGFQIGDTVEIEKRGGIIPAVKRSVTRDQRLREISDRLPTVLPIDRLLAVLDTDRPPFDLVRHIGGKCPSCGSTDIRKQVVDGEDGARWCCMNPSCPAQLARRIEHFCSRKALDIEGIGAEMSIALADAMQQMNITSLFDLLGWMESDLMVMSWTTDSGGTMTFGASRAAKAVAAFARAKKLPLHRWLTALGLPTIGENTPKEISRLFRDAGELRVLDENPSDMPEIIYLLALGTDKTKGQLAQYQISHHLGPVSAKVLWDYMNSEEGLAVFRQLAAWGVKSDNYAPIPEAKTGKLAGKTFCVTGTLSEPRDAIHALITAAGGVPVDSVSKKTSFLVAGDKAGSKLAKAEKAGVAILTEDALRAML